MGLFFSSRSGKNSAEAGVSFLQAIPCTMHSKIVEKALLRDLRVHTEIGGLMSQWIKYKETDCPLQVYS